eukprot:766028-Hanusia_phi.AAC.1
MIAGGGGGGMHLGGGGGAGGYYLSTEAGNSKIIFSANTTYTIVIGHGGIGGNGLSPVSGANGSDTVIKDSSGVDILRVKGGGQAAGSNDINGTYTGTDGGCGGGGVGYNNTTVNNPSYSNGGSAVNVDGKGYGGGTGVQYQNAPDGTRYILGGGGGGIGGAGENADNRQYEPGNGGDALTIDLTGTEEAFGGGGAGGTWYYSGLAYGGASLVNGSSVIVGGNGARSSPQVANTTGAPNTGSGGGGGNNATYYNGKGGSDDTPDRRRKTSQNLALISTGQTGEFIGYLQDLRIFNRALTSDEINDIRYYSGQGVLTVQGFEKPYTNIEIDNKLDNIPAGYTDADVALYLTNNNYATISEIPAPYTDTDVLAYLTANDYVTSTDLPTPYTDTDVQAYLTANDYATTADLPTPYTDTDVQAYLTANDYVTSTDLPTPYTDTDVQAYLTANDYITSTDLPTPYTDTDVQAYLTTNDYITSTDLPTPYTDTDVQAYLTANDYVTSTDLPSLFISDVSSDFNVDVNGLLTLTKSYVLFDDVSTLFLPDNQDPTITPTKTATQVTGSTTDFYVKLDCGDTAA